MNKLEATIKFHNAEFEESYVGFWESPRYNHYFDLNSGGAAVMHIDESVGMIDYLPESASNDEIFAFFHKHIEKAERADAPF